MVIDFIEYTKENENRRLSIMQARNSYIKYLSETEGIEYAKEWYKYKDYKVLYDMLKTHFRLSGCKCNASNVIIHVKE